MAEWDAVVVGAGPNGLAAAIEIARAGRRVLVLEANDTAGGAARTAELTLPGFLHDLGSAIHPLAYGSPFFRRLMLEDVGLEWVQPPVPLAHPLDGGAVLLERSMEATADGLGPDARMYRRVMGPLTASWEEVVPDVLGPLRFPRHPLALARFGLLGLPPATLMARTLFRGERARALFAGLAAHSFLPLERPPSASFALALGVLAHVCGWPFPRGGAQRIADALTARLRSLGGELVTGRRIGELAELPPARTVLLDLTPRQIAAIAAARLPTGYLGKLRGYRYGPGVFKLDYALSGPIPWTAPEVRRAGTVHLGGTMEEIAAGERAVWEGRHPARPFVLLAQPTLFDPSRAPVGKHTAWAYCHVPNGSAEDMTERIEGQIERFAPGFGELVLARTKSFPADLKRMDANLVGGDINGGVQDLRQLYTRPTLRISPYTTPTRHLYICSSSTPPGGGVHGMCGYQAARVALRRSLAG